ncbi:MAG TPA: transketolase [Candidatus Woesebacteria bacterium]|nr:transketolase [Candidatus Woesebacteria bacterium]
MVDLAEKAREIRVEIIRMLRKAESGHSAGALGAADLFACLYFGELLNFRCKEPYWEERDRLVLSCGHYAPVWYASLALAGFFPMEELMTLRKLGSRLQGHPVRVASTSYTAHKQLPGVENTGGPLGQGVSIAVGMALAAKRDKKKWKTVCICSDAEQQEGQTWEAYQTASKYDLGNLWFVIDRNEIQISGNVHEVMPIEPLVEKLKAFGLRVIEVDGNDIDQIIMAFEKGKLFPDEPKVIVMRTVAGKGVSFMERDFRWHGKAPTDEESEKALWELK